MRIRTPTNEVKMTERCTNPCHRDIQPTQCPDCTIYHICVADDCCTRTEKDKRQQERAERVRIANRRRINDRYESQ